MTTPIVAVVLIGVIAAGVIILLGAVQTARTRAMTRRRLAETIPESAASHALGTVSHNSSADRVRRATGELNVADVQQALDEARAMEENG